MNVIVFIRKHKQKAIALIFWLLLIGGYVGYMQVNDLSVRNALQQIVDFAARSTYAPLIYILLYAVRPLVFGSTVIMTSSAGYLFGPTLGALYAVIGGNLSASLAFFVGRYFGQGVLDHGKETTLLQKYASRIRRNSFETVLLMRLLLLPYDAISYLAGFLQIRWLEFALATLIGGFPGAIAFSLFGASLESNDGSIALNPWTLIGSVALFIISFGLSWYLKRRENKRDTSPPNTI